MSAEVVQSTNSLSIFIPVISTILGACIAFLASFLSVKLTKDKDAAHSLESRDRSRIERVYKLLVILNNNASKDMGQCVNHIHRGTKYVDKEVEELPPLIELEMLVKLYMPNSDSSYENLVKKIQEFYVKLMEFRFKKYEGDSKKCKQEDCGVLVALHGSINKKVNEFKTELTFEVKA
jgi:hypothetical protein